LPRDAQLSSLADAYLNNGSGGVSSRWCRGAGPEAQRIQRCTRPRPDGEETGSDREEPIREASCRISSAGRAGSTRRRGAAGTIASERRPDGPLQGERT
jgi:hypothetical protein